MKFFFINILIILSCKYIFAQSLFDSDFYEVNFISDNIIEDKKNKINEIKYQTIKKIFNRILIEDDYKSFKRNLNDNTINYFIKNILIENEKIILENYSSQIKVNYDKNKIISYLRDNKISYLEYLPNDFITIIYENNKLSKNLFDKNNLHYQYLKNNKLDFFKLPLFDTNDKFLLSIKDIETFNLKKLENFSNKYSNKDLLIIIANNNNDNIKYELYLYTQSKILNVNNFNYASNDFIYIFDKIKYNTIQSWKFENKIQNIKLLNIYCSISYYNLLELSEVKSKIQNVSIIKNMELIKLSFQKNVYKINFYGNIQILPSLFKLNNLKIKISENECKINL